MIRTKGKSQINFAPFLLARKKRVEIWEIWKSGPFVNEAQTKCQKRKPKKAPSPFSHSVVCCSCFVCGEQIRYPTLFLAKTRSCVISAGCISARTKIESIFRAEGSRCWTFEKIPWDGSVLEPWRISWMYILVRFAWGFSVVHDPSFCIFFPWIKFCVPRNQYLVFFCSLIGSQALSDLLLGRRVSVNPWIFGFLRTENFCSEEEGFCLDTIHHFPLWLKHSFIQQMNFTVAAAAHFTDLNLPGNFSGRQVGKNFYSWNKKITCSWCWACQKVLHKLNSWKKVSVEEADFFGIPFSISAWNEKHVEMH